MPLFLNLLHKIKKKGILPNSFYEFSNCGPISQVYIGRVFFLEAKTFYLVIQLILDFLEYSRNLEILVN